MKLKFKFGILEFFIAFLLVLFLVDLSLNYYEELRREKAVFHNYFEHTSQSIYSEIIKFSTPADEIINISKHFFYSGQLNIGDYKALNNFFIPFMTAHPYITSINLGDEKGNAYLILRLGNLYKNRIKKWNMSGKVIWIYLNEIGEELKKELVADDYDPRNRPWYLIARDNSTINWSSPYVFRTTKDVGITASSNISPDKSTKIVIGLDIMLKDLSRFLFQINNTYKGAKIKIISQDSKIVASSDKGFEEFLKKDDPTLLDLTAKRDQLFYNAYNTYNKNKTPFIHINLDGEKYHVSVKQMSLSSDYKMFLFISLPESAFLINYRHSAVKKSLIYLVILLIGGFIIIKRYLIPLRKLSVAISDYPVQGYQSLSFVERHDEVGIIANEFAKMAKDLDAKTNQLLLSENNYRLLFESNPLPFLIIDKETLQILKANKAALRLYGASETQLSILTLNDLSYDNEKNITLRFDEVTKGILKHKKLDGTYVFVEVHSNSIIWHNKEAILMLCVDITQRLILEEQLHQAQNLQRIGILAGGIAHEFNNILAAILGYASLMELKMDLHDPQLKNVREIIKACQKAVNLVSEMLAFGRKQLLEIKKFNLNDMINDFLPTITTVLNNQHSVETALSTTPLYVNADKNRLEQVLLNLALHAKDAMSGRGKITIITNKVLISQKHFPSLSDGYYALIQFSDNGTGMDEYTKKHIFDPFFTTKEVGKGTGLGLSVVYGIIKQHGGDISVESSIGSGATFFIYLPLVNN